MSKTKVELIGENGNIFNLMAKASQAMKKESLIEESKEMCQKLMNSGSYDEALQIIMEYCNIS